MRESTRLANGTNYRADEPLVISAMHLFHVDEPRVAIIFPCTTMGTRYLIAECLGPIGECTAIISYILLGKSCCQVVAKRSGWLVAILLYSMGERVSDGANIAAVTAKAVVL